MKILSYNISWSKQFKVDWLFTHKDIDAFVVPECGNNENIVVPNNYQFYWVGNYPTKGLGVFISKEHKQEIPVWANKELNYAIPLLINDEYLCLAPNVGQGLFFFSGSSVFITSFTAHFSMALPISC